MKDVTISYISRKGCPMRKLGLSVLCLCVWVSLCGATDPVALPKIPLMSKRLASTPDSQVVYKVLDQGELKKGKRELKVSVFMPSTYKKGEMRPAIVFFFGGGWTGGTPRQFYTFARSFARQGHVALSADYRTKGSHGTTPFECVADARDAIAWVRHHAVALGVDPQRVIAAGGSAGGHLAVCTGVITQGVPVESIPNAMILMNPVVDTSAHGYGGENFKKGAAEKLSPCHHVGEKRPPVLIVHGTADKTVRYENVERFSKLMHDKGNVCELHAFEGLDHGFFNHPTFKKGNPIKSYQEVLALSLAFAQRVLPSSHPKGSNSPNGD